MELGSDPRLQESNNRSSLQRALPEGFPVQVFAAARRKLEALEAAERLDDLRVPPGNRLEVMSGDRKGQHSIRINDQWRICFRWTNTGPADVEIVDYH